MSQKKNMTAAKEKAIDVALRIRDEGRFWLRMDDKPRRKRPMSELSEVSSLIEECWSRKERVICCHTKIVV